MCARHVLINNTRPACLARPNTSAKFYQKRQPRNRRRNSHRQFVVHWKHGRRRGAGTGRGSRRRLAGDLCCALHNRVGLLISSTTPPAKKVAHFVVPTVVEARASHGHHVVLRLEMFLQLPKYPLLGTIVNSKFAKTNRRCNHCNRRFLRDHWLRRIHRKIKFFNNSVHRVTGKVRHIPTLVATGNNCTTHS